MAEYDLPLTKRTTSPRSWPTARSVAQNATDTLSNGLGTVEVGIALLLLTEFVSIPTGAVGAVLSFQTSLVTLSFLVTKPEVWVPALGNAERGSPFCDVATGWSSKTLSCSPAGSF